MSGPTSRPHLGWLDVCLDVKDVKLSVEFYSKLGFEMVQGDLDKGWAVVVREGWRIGLYHGHIPKAMLNFRGGDVFAQEKAILAAGLTMDSPASRAKDGTAAATIKDPDGYPVSFNSTTSELSAIRQGHIEIFVSNPDASRRFYEEVLGFQVTSPQGSEFVRLEQLGLRILLRLGGRPHPSIDYRKASSAIVLYTGNLEETVSKLKARGLVFRGTDGSDYRPTLTDPDGNWFQLVNPDDR